MASIIYRYAINYKFLFNSLRQLDNCIYLEYSAGLIILIHVFWGWHSAMSLFHSAVWALGVWIWFLGFYLLIYLLLLLFGSLSIGQHVQTGSSNLSLNRDHFHGGGLFILAFLWSERLDAKPLPKSYSVNTFQSIQFSRSLSWRDNVNTKLTLKWEIGCRVYT